MRYVYIGAMLAFCARPAVAQSLIEQIGWRGASWTAIGIIVLAIGGGGAALLLAYVGKRRNLQRDFEALADRRFLDTAERFGLSQDQVRKARELLQFERTLEPQVILQSVSVFERCVDRAIQAMVSAGVDDSERQSANDLISGIRAKAGFAQLPLEHPLVSSRNIEIGQSGSLFGADHRNPLIQRATVVQSNEFFFTLQYDIEHEDAIHLAPGHEIKFTFARRNDGMYGIPVQVLRVDGRGNVDVGHTLSLRRNQLRQYVRIEASFSAKARLIRTDEPDSNQVKRGESVDAKLSDISGGGLSFLCERSFRAGDVITLSFALPNARFAGVASKVLRISLQEGKTVTYFKHHVQFVDIDQRKRDQIVKYVFEKQRQISQWR